MSIECPMCGGPVRVVSSGGGTNHYEAEAAALDVERLAQAADTVGMGTFWVESPSAPVEDDIPFVTMTFDFDAWAAALAAEYGRRAALEEGVGE